MRALVLLLCLAAVPAGAAEVAGVRIDDKTRVGNTDLVLNGAGLRKRFFLQVYAIGLYLPQKASRPDAIFEQPGPKRVAIHMLRDVSADAFSEAMSEGIRANHAEAEVKGLEPRVKELAALFAELKEAKKGMALALDWTGNATQLMAQGKPVGRPIEGVDFYRALLRIWIGDKPVQDDLKAALLGG
jgi:hypothetical protein